MRAKLTRREILKYSLLGGLVGPVLAAVLAVGFIVSGRYHPSVLEVIAFLALAYVGAVLELLCWYFVIDFD